MKLKLLSLSLCGLLAAIPAKATTVYALTNGGNILSFDHTTPGTVTSVTPTPAVIGSYVLLAIDVRPTIDTTSPMNPGAGSLWAIGRSGTSFQLFVIDPATGVTTAIGAPYAAGIDSSPGVNTWGFDFNPSVDRIRLVSSGVPAPGLSNNYRLNPNNVNGTSTQDLTLNYTSGTPQIDAVAYTSAPFGGTTTLYGLDSNLNVLTKADAPNDGTFATVGALGADIDEPNGFDIFNSLALFSVATVAGAELYSVNLTTGAATLVGSFPALSNIRGLAISLTGTPPPPLDTPPTLKINGKTKRTVTQTPAIVKGKATDESGVVALSYRVANRTSSYTGTAYNTPFQMKIRKLDFGNNRVDIRAIDPTGNVTKKRITIVRH
jgi:Domain of unknown function (DUF4394)